MDDERTTTGTGGDLEAGELEAGQLAETSSQAETTATAAEAATHAEAATAAEAAKDPAAVALGRRGGFSRWGSMTAEERSAEMGRVSRLGWRGKRKSQRARKRPAAAAKRRRPSSST